MKFLRAVAIGALFWLLIFIEISVTMIGLKFSDSTTYIIHYILMIPIAMLCAWLYYKGEGNKKGKTNGFVLGLFMAIVGIILDMIITVPMFIIPQGGSYAAYFSNLYLIAGLIEGVVLIGLYGMIKK
jgi:hypothetical protein